MPRWGVVRNGEAPGGMSEHSTKGFGSPGKLDAVSSLNQTELETIKAIKRTQQGRRMLPCEARLFKEVPRRRTRGRRSSAARRTVRPAGARRGSD